MVKIKNLGLVAGIIVSSSAPTNTKVIWYDTGANKQKYYDTINSTWRTFGTNNVLFLNSARIATNILGTESTLIDNIVVPSININPNSVLLYSHLKFKLTGIYNSDPSSALAGTIRLRLNGVALGSAVLNFPNNQINQPIKIEGSIRYQKVGVSGEIIIDFRITYFDGTQTILTGLYNSLGISSPVTIDTTIPNTFDITGQYAGASSADTILILTSSVEQIEL